MKLQTKFFFLSMISIICGLVLLYTAYSTIVSTAELPHQLSLIQASLHNQSYRASTSYAVESDVWRGMYAYKENDKEDMKDAINSIQYHIKDYRDNIVPEEVLNLSAEVDRNIKIANEQFENAIDKAQMLMLNLDSPNFLTHINDLHEMFVKVNQINDTVYYQILDLTAKLRTETRDTIKEAIKTSIGIAIFVIALICFICILSYYTLFVPLTKIINIMHFVEQDGWKEEIPFTNRADEIGDIANAIEVFRFHNLEKQALEEDAKMHATKMQEDRHKHLLIFAASFEKTVKEISDKVALASVKMDETAKDLAQQANNIQGETEQLALSSVKTNSNIKDVSEAVNDFSDSASEIADQVISALKYTDQASKQTDNINKVVIELEAKAKAISGILDIINHIASQIELLALNATIEAARAGDFGKGFAVVANEVKALATQTTKATEQVNAQISGMQDSTEKAVSAIKEITDSVKTINQTSASISLAVKEQNEVSTNIAAKASQVASMSESVNLSINKVAKSSRNSEEVASQMVTESVELAKQATMLQTEVDNFLSSLKTS